MSSGDLPLVSTIIPVYNGAAYLADAIESVLQQTYPNIEIIAIDDGSTDSSKEVLHSFGDRIRWSSQKNAGVAAARNTALGLARGKYSALLDQDDLWLPDKIQVQVDAFESNPKAEMVWSNTLYSQSGRIDQNTPLRHDDLKDLNLGGLLKHNRIPTLTAMFKTATVLSIGGFDEISPPCDDWDMWIRLHLLGEAIYLDKDLAIYRIHPYQESRKTLKMILGEIHVAKKHREAYLGLPGGQKFYNKELSQKLSFAGMEALKLQNYAVARSFALRSLAVMQPDCMLEPSKILIESLLGTPLYSKIVSSLKKIAGRN